ncbi:hypothetical protein [Streptomyces sp. MJP52]|uniref:hypothetical protein n=1 Tax=Streptomyces sp. MJP52 TaxID=2940555 RepID=UPI0024747A0F|nr:hypothetical protein [Streptomyces sp. MJP52]MDH6225671.1 hypothetical protein [Streptomyces sp. MJP52]
MKLRRALAVAAAAAVVAPLTLLSAPVASAEDTVPSPSRTLEQRDAAHPEAGSGDPAGEAGGATAPESAPATGTPDDRARDGAPGGAGEPGAGSARPGDDLPDHALCDKGAVDEGLRTKVTGLPARIEAGAGWDEFRFTVTNDTGKDLDRLWLALAVTYQENPEMLAEGLAEIQYRHDGRWSDDEYHRWPGSTGSYQDTLPDVPAGATFTADLRIRVSGDASAGAAWGYTDVVYDEDLTCHRNGGRYEFAVVAAGPARPGEPGPEPAPSPSGTATPGPAGPPAPSHPADPAGTEDRTGPRGRSGSLAETGGGSVPAEAGALGAAALVLGAATVLAVRRGRPANRA